MEYLPDADAGIPADTVEIDSALLVRPFPNPAFLFAFATSTYNPERFKSITMILTPATNDYSRYHPGSSMQLGYSCPEAMVFDSQLVSRPAAILTPYPNPAVVAEMHGQNLRFRFQTPLDSLSLPPSADPVVSLDLFDVAGQRLRTINMVRLADLRLGLWESDWDMTNASGSPVASGVYLCVARLFSSPNAAPLIESTVKVLIVR
jgi:hypothetical protein